MEARIKLYKARFTYTIDQIVISVVSSLPSPTRVQVPVPRACHCHSARPRIALRSLEPSICGDKHAYVLHIIKS